jgi:serine/threonine protein kinase
MQTAPLHAPEVGMRFGRYELLGRLGAGGMGEVYRARDLELLRDVAVKFLPEPYASNPVRLARFTREARTASSLNHPNILTVHDIGQAEGLHFMVTELVEGVTLRQLLRAEFRLSTRRALDLAAQMAEGLAKAHAGGIVHRDIKPENVMVTPDGRVKILDFGIAKLHDATTGEDRDTGVSDLPTWPGDHRPDAHLSDGSLVGTVGYVSPEQARGRPLDHRSDQFALGTTLYEMVTGRRAFGRESRTETLAAIIADEPEPIAGLIPEFPAPARWILECCLAKDPADRYASTADLAHALRNLRDHLSEVERGGSAAAGTRWWARSLWLPPESALLDAGATARAEPDGEDPLRDHPLREAMTFRWTRLDVGSAVAETREDGDAGDPLPTPHERENASVVDGRVERRGDWVRITARLVDAVDAKDRRGSALSTGDLLAVAAAMADLLAGRDETGASTHRPLEGVLATGATRAEPAVRAGGERTPASHERTLGGWVARDRGSG